MTRVERGWLLAIGALILLISSRATAQFETRGSLPVSAGPWSVATGDFNHDGKLDMAVLGNQLQVLLGEGDGTFKPPVTYPVGDGNGVFAVVSADFNHDSNLDLAVADSAGVSVLLGNADGTFQPAVNYGPLPAKPVSILVGDFNGDHKLDVITAGNPYISVLLGNGDGTFQQPINTGPITVEPIGIGDFNRDGKLDVAVGQSLGGTSQVQILLGNGDGTFTTGPAYIVGSEPTSVAVADFNGDKKLDLAVAAFEGQAIYVLLGNGDGTFQSAGFYLLAFPHGVVAADLNGDGKLDLAEAQFGPPPGVSVLYGNGDGTFGPATYYADGATDWTLAAGDFNRDGHPDLIVADYQSNTVITMLNTGVVSFTPNIPVNFPTQLIGTSSSPQNVTLTNTGSAALSIHGKAVRGPFQLASGTTCGKSVATGATCTLSVVFQPTAIGTANGLLSLSDSASSKPQVIELSGVGTVISLSPTSLDFGSQKVGTKSAPQDVTVTNVGSTTVNVTSLKLTGKEVHDFVETTTCRTQIGPGASCTISVTFAPTTTGDRSANVQITHDGGGSPQTVPLSGVGD